MSSVTETLVLQVEGQCKQGQCKQQSLSSGFPSYKMAGAYNSYLGKMINFTFLIHECSTYIVCALLNKLTEALLKGTLDLHVFHFNGVYNKFA